VKVGPSYKPVLRLRPFLLCKCREVLEIPVSALNFVRIPPGLPWINLMSSRIFLTLLKTLGTTHPIVFHTHVDDLFGDGFRNLAQFVFFLKDSNIRFVTALELTRYFKTSRPSYGEPEGGKKAY